MPKSKIIQAIVDDDVDLVRSLTRLQVLAHDLRNKELEKWAENELVGYSSEDDVPEYRHAKSINFTYSGINNMVHQVENAPLDPGFLGEDVLNQIADVRFTQSLIAFEALLERSDSSILLDRSIFASVVDKNSNGGIQCFSIGQVIPKSFVQDALAEIKNRLLKSLLLLEEEFGCLDELGIDVAGHSPSRIEHINYEINSGILHIQVDPPAQKEEPIGSKIAWNVVVPIITTLVGGLIGAAIQPFLGLLMS
ncbi:AbiTii domain-containing protein [Slackia sp.]|uniref:AbiTii domain-containing protein n=1 Tax=Slackia sp. TaxID=2049041 RepID=UPI0026270474|nr:hypothetical protein [Slackia sp.]MEE0519102.1 hypothetical protein [Slackia sp.]